MYICMFEYKRITNVRINIYILVYIPLHIDR